MYIPNDRELVKCHRALVSAIDSLVCKQTSSCHHVGSHTITNEHENVLGLADLLNVSDQPFCDCLGAIVAEGCCVLARLVQCYSSPGLGSYIDLGWGIGVFGEQISAAELVPW